MSTAKPSGPAGPPYRDPARPLNERVDDLLGQMTTAEKIAQLGAAWVFELIDVHSFEVSPDKIRSLSSSGIGQITRVSGASSLGSKDAAALANAIQRFLVEETRLGIPAIVHEEVCSGLMAREATVFPQAIGVASTWDPGLAREMGDAIRHEMRAIGAHQGLSPVLDVCRDPRWGRTEETFGEDPYLVARMGMAMVQGLQGTDLSTGVVATGKHFVGYSASEGGLNWAPAHIPARELREVYLHPFEAAVRAAGLRSVMNGYHELDGVPCAANSELHSRLLRDTWGFEGCVVADYFSIRQLEDYHQMATDAAAAASLAILAGIDVELPGTDCYGAPLMEALESNMVSESVLDRAVKRVLSTKFELGLFEQPYVDPDTAMSTVGSSSHAGVAGEVARKSVVLLKNDGVLPLPADSSKVAVIGPNADEARHLFGDYTYPAHVEALMESRQNDEVSFHIPLPDEAEMTYRLVGVATVFEALRERLGSRVSFARGCEVNSVSKEGFAEAVDLAASSDVAVMVMGDKSGLVNDCTSGEARDRASLDLPGVQEELLREVIGTGTPVVLVLIAGRPSASAWAHERCAAAMIAWMPGQEGAAAIADVLVGAVNPGGKLPISYPRNSGQIPIYYGHKVSGGRSQWKGDYVDSAVSPLYPFGHGLSYTTFEVSDLSVDKASALVSESVTVTARVANTGSIDGEEVLQLYVRDPVASVTRPVLELKGFVRVEVPAGASREVAFELPVAQLGFYDAEMEYSVEPGQIDVYVGTSSANAVHAGSFNIAPVSGVAVDKVFDGTVTVSEAD
jgi:beta-glucosidase